MDKVVSIVNQKPTELEFELGIDGMSPKDIKVQLCLKAADHYLVFDAKKQKGDNWSVKIPALPHLEKGAFPYHIHVIADGYYFEAAKGTANVTGSFDVYVKKPGKVQPGEVEKEEQKIVKKAEKKEDKKEEKKEAPKKKVAKETVIPLTKPEPEKKTLEEVGDLADEILGKYKKPVKKATKKQPVTEEKQIAKPAAKEPEEKPLVEDDVVKKIIAEAKKSKTVWKPKPRKIKAHEPEEKKPIIEVEEKEEPVVSETDVIVKKLLEEQKAEKQEKQRAAPAFKKGKVVRN